MAPLGGKSILFGWKTGSETDWIRFLSFCSVFIFGVNGIVVGKR